MRPSGRSGTIAAHYLRMILANDDRARTMHTVAARTDRELLPARVAAVLDRNNQRRADCAQDWRWHSTQTRARNAAYQRFTAATRGSIVVRERGRGVDRGYGLEL